MDMVMVRVATVNDDFTDRKTSLPLVARYAHVMLTQENKHDNVRSLLPASAWNVFQVMDSESTRGSAVCWRVGGAFRAAKGLSRQVEAARGRGILPRRLTIVHGRVGVAPVTFIAAHRPLKKTRLQPMFDAALVARCFYLRRARRFIVVGIDANERNPHRLARRCGLRWHAPRGSIDGFFVSPHVRVANLKRLPKWHSDHHPVIADMTFPQRSKA